MPPPRKLEHQTSRGTVRDWRGLKLKALAIAEAYLAADPTAHRDRAERMVNCANRLRFTRTPEGLLQLRNSHACKNRLCATCQAATARRDFAILMARVNEHARAHPGALPVMLTVTVRNVASDQLKPAVIHLLGAFRKLTRMPRVTRAVMGWHRSLEITRNVVRNDFHPHVHALLWVRPGYFTTNSPLFLTQPDWVSLWAKATGQGAAIVDIRRLGKDRDGVLDLAADGLFELTKYAVKPAGFVEQIGIGWRVDPTILATIHTAIKGRRLRDVGGTMRKIPKPAWPRRPTDAELEAALIAIETYEFGDWVEPEHGEILTDYWQRAPPDPSAP